MDHFVEGRETVGPLKELTQATLNRCKITDKGEEIPNLPGGGQLIRIPDLEETLWRVPRKLITPNPDQPRSYFRADKLRELEVSMRAKGQKVPVELAPYEEQSTGNIRLFLKDGERRFRVAQSVPYETVKGEISSVLTLEELFEDALIINEGRDPHNPMERAVAYKRLVEFKRARGIASPIQEVAERLAISDQTVYNHLKLLELPEEIQAMVVRDQVPTSELFHLANTKRKLGDKFSLARVARILLDNLHKEKPTQVNAKGITAKGVRDATRQALLEGGNEQLANELETQQSTYRLLNGLNGILKATEIFTRDSSRKDVIRILRSRKSPPEVLRDKIRLTMEKLELVMEVVEDAIKPDPLPEVPGKPRFTDFVREKTARKFSNSETRYRLALAVAKSSDQKDIVSASELAVFLKTDINTVAANLRILDGELRTLGIVLQQHTIREKDNRDHYDKKAAYRLAWKVEAEKKAVKPETSKKEIVEEASSVVSSQPPTPVSPKAESVVHQTENNVPAGKVKKHIMRGPAPIIGPKVAPPPPSKVKIIPLEETLLKSEEVVGEKDQVRGENIPEVYSLLCGKKVLVLDRNHKNYKQLADQLHLGSKEVIIIILGLMKVL